MPTLTRFFFRMPYHAGTTGAIVRWWESRRLMYNASVGAAGVISLAAVALADSLPPHARTPGIPWGGIVIYAVLANLCFTAGPVVDSFICRRFGPSYSAVGPALFRYGFVFAVGLTLLPVPVALAGWGLRLLGVIP